MLDDPESVPELPQAANVTEIAVRNNQTHGAKAKSPASARPVSRIIGLSDCKTFRDPLSNPRLGPLADRNR